MPPAEAAKPNPNKHGVKPGDAVLFRFHPDKEPALGKVVHVHPSGHADIEYRGSDPTIPGNTQARGIAPVDADSGAHGYFPAPKAAAQDEAAE